MTAQLYANAQTAFTHSDMDTTFALCTEALNHRATTGELRLKIMLLLLAAADIQWRGHLQLPGGLSVPDLYTEAERLAANTNKALLAQLRMMQGNWLLITTGLPPALAKLREAHQAAGESQDPMLEFLTLSALGHQTVKVNMAEGIDLLHRAQTLYNLHQDTIDTQTYSPELRRYQALTLAFLGINEFDNGSYSKASALLHAAYEKSRLRYDLPIILNFLAQVEITSGEFESAEAHLHEAIALFDRQSTPNAWNGNNLALLGKLYIECERLEDAAEPLERGWRETEPTHNLDLISLVRNYYGEFLMHPLNPQRDFAKAEHFLQQNLTETRAAHIHRSTIQALSLLGQLMLYKQDSENALAYSQEAADILDQLGNMPALRMEEIYFNHYLVLQAANCHSEAAAYLHKARQALNGIVTDNKETFLTRIPLNRAILNA